MLRLTAHLATWLAGTALVSAASQVVPTDAIAYPDGRPAASYRLDAKDHGAVLKHGDGPGQCDSLGARDAWVFEDAGTYYMHYDAAGPKGWLCSLATSKDLVDWEKKRADPRLRKTRRRRLQISLLRRDLS